MQTQAEALTPAPGRKPMPFILRFFQLFESLGVLLMLPACLVLFWKQPNVPQNS